MLFSDLKERIIQVWVAVGRSEDGPLSWESRTSPCSTPQGAMELAKQCELENPWTEERLAIRLDDGNLVLLDLFCSAIKQPERLHDGVPLS